MKKFLLSFILSVSVGLWLKLEAQPCDLFNLEVKINSIGADPAHPGNCLLNLDMDFDMHDNHGNKRIYIHLWKSTDYGFINFDYNAPPAKGPELDDIDGADDTHPPVATIGIDNFSSPEAYLTTYVPDPSHITPITGTSITITHGALDHFTFKDVVLSIPGGCGGLVLKGDIWSTQANSDISPIHCALQGLTFAGDPIINGTILCGLPQRFQVLLTTVSTSALTVNYKVYIDNGIVGVKDAPDVLVFTSAPAIILSSIAPHNSGFVPYAGDPARPLLIELFVTSPYSATVYAALSGSCTVLPVNLKSFTAIRNRSNVDLTWVTASEQNNTGFEVQRNSGSGNWQKAGFISSRASGGNSTSQLSYSFNDLNTTKGITQYRLVQIDMNGKTRFSEVRAVRGEGQKMKTIIYPNPSLDGKVNAVFEDIAGTRDIMLMDINGRLLKQWRALSVNNIQIDNLSSGVYDLRVTIRETGLQTAERIVVSKH